MGNPPDDRIDTNPWESQRLKEAWVYSNPKTAREAQPSSENFVLVVDGNYHRAPHRAKCAEQETWRVAHSKGEVSISPFFSSLRDLCRRGSGKIFRVKDFKETVFSRPNMSDNLQAHRDCDSMRKACLRFSKTISAWRKEEAIWKW